ncbi:MAG: hypothetical protein LBK53_05945 [Heliobacteriaceae bacterium]|nr:hypothetical protein [Heliobacteriaceae bacterium]
MCVARLPSLAKKYGLNLKTVQKWKNRNFTYDAPLGITSNHQQGKLQMFVGIDRTSKFAFAKLYKTKTQ